MAIWKLGRWNLPTTLGLPLGFLRPEREGTTRFTSVIRYPSREVRDQVIATGMEDGMREAYRQLDEVVGSLAP